MRIAAFAGGVGGAKLAHGLSRVMNPKDLTVIVNTGDDFSHFGLSISPDVDTVVYTLCEKANPTTGWGLNDDTFIILREIGNLGGPTWFNLGDKDLATHLERTRLLFEGKSLSEITGIFAQRWGASCKIIPMSDDMVHTMVETREYGVIGFQEYFVRYQCSPTVMGFEFAGIEKAAPAPGVLEAIHSADVIIFCPSNPWVSIWPILSIRTVLDAVQKKSVVIAVSPLIGESTVKGPAAKMYREMNFEPSPLAVADHYKGIITGFVIDEGDKKFEDELIQWGIIPRHTDILMRDISERERLANFVLDFARDLQK